MHKSFIFFNDFYDSKQTKVFLDFFKNLKKKIPTFC